MHSLAVGCPLPGRLILSAVSCPPAIHVPRLNEASKYPTVKLTGLGEIIQDTQMVQPRKILQNKTNGIIFLSQMLISGYAFNKVEI